MRGLAFAYPDGHRALFGVDLHVHRGERVAMSGLNGAGKTTLVLHLNGILTAGSGAVAVSGLPVTKDNLAEIRRCVGIVFQDPTTSCSCRRSAMTWRSGRATSACAATSSTPGCAMPWSRWAWPSSPTGRRTTCPSASGGVAVATVLAMNPEILVLDEPSSNLDPASRRELADIIRSRSSTVRW